MSPNRGRYRRPLSPSPRDCLESGRAGRRLLRNGSLPKPCYCVLPPRLRVKSHPPLPPTPKTTCPIPISDSTPLPVLSLKDKQLAANRTNAAQSTGPRSPEGRTAPTRPLGPHTSVPRAKKQWPSGAQRKRVVDPSGYDLQTSIFAWPGDHADSVALVGHALACQSERSSDVFFPVLRPSRSGQFLHVERFPILLRVPEVILSLLKGRLFPFHARLPVAFFLFPVVDFTRARS